MTSSQQRQAAYWDAVATQISDANTECKDLVGYHSPYDLHVRQCALALLDDMCALVDKKSSVAELGSGAGLNLKYFAEKWHPKQLVAYDCSSQLLAQARANLSSRVNVEYHHTTGYDLPTPSGASIDLLFTMTVLQHITDDTMFRSIVASMKQTGARYILLIEDTRSVVCQPVEEYIQRPMQEYISLFEGESYTLVKVRFVSLSWAARLYGVINRLLGLYHKPEGASTSKPVILVSKLLQPVASAMDLVWPGSFGMSAILLKRKSDD